MTSNKKENLNNKLTNNTKINNNEISMKKKINENNKVELVNSLGLFKFFIIFVFVISCFVLFFFPSPASNLLAYFGTFLVFVGLLIFLINQYKSKI